MPQKINFVKMHGLGNDFVFVNKQDLLPSEDFSKLAKNIANRYTGIGCDQFVIYEEKANSYEMFIYNTDGSSAKMCGNATRCLAKLINLNTGKSDIPITCGGRKLVCGIVDENTVSVELEPVSFEEAWIPKRENVQEFGKQFGVELADFCCVDVGNPHLVIFGEFDHDQQKILGKNFQDKILFPDGVNVSFANVQNNKIHLSVWERGVGFTFACGSAACASASAALKLGRVPSPVQVVFKYGSLFIKEVNKSSLIMDGPGKLVARGEYFCEQ